MQIRRVFISLCVLGAIYVLGWLSSSYLEEVQRKSESMLLLDQATSAIQACNFEAALVHASQAQAMYKESPVAGLMVKELMDGRTAFDQKCLTTGKGRTGPGQTVGQTARK